MRKSKYDNFVHEFGGLYYVCEWNSKANQMKKIAPKSIGGWFVCTGYSEQAALYVGAISYTTRRQALKAAQKKYCDQIL